jgi:Zn-dependent protease
MAFNLLPIPPLDGGHVMEQVLPWDLRDKFRRIQAFGLLIILALWFTGILGRIIGFIFWVLMSLIRLGFGQGYVEYVFAGF